jgi:teichuronic acid biosynthesis glycosyltransferase TuaG
MKEPLVSVVIAMFNAEKYIYDTIVSVLNQTYKNIEIVVVDDCSTDKSYSIVENLIKEYNNIKLLKLEKNSGGPAKPRNKGILESQGEYIAFLDADDLWKSDKLDKQINFMKLNQINFCSANLSLIDKNGNDIKKIGILSKVKNLFTNKKTLCDLIVNRHIALSSVLIKKDLLNKFNEENNFIAVEDFYLWLEVLNKKNTKYKYLDEKLLMYRILENSISHEGNKYKHEVKASYAVLVFILKYKRFEIFPCLLKSIILQNIRLK